MYFSVLADDLKINQSMNQSNLHSTEDSAANGVVCRPPWPGPDRRQWGRPSNNRRLKKSAEAALTTATPPLTRLTVITTAARMAVPPLRRKSRRRGSPAVGHRGVVQGRAVLLQPQRRPDPVPGSGKSDQKKKCRGRPPLHTHTHSNIQQYQCYFIHSTSPIIERESIFND